MSTHARLISEPIEPVVSTMDTAHIALGQPDMPRLFTWRGTEYAVAEVLETWKEASPCKCGAAEQYVRKHWFRVRTTDGSVMQIYFQRQPASGRGRRKRWWLYTIVPSPETV